MVAAEAVLDLPASVTFDAGSGVVSGAGLSVRLAHREAQIFEALWDAKGRNVSSGMLVELVYDMNDEPEDPAGNIHTFISRMRRRLAVYGIAIHSRRFQGYWVEVSRGGREKIAPIALQEHMGFQRSLGVIIYDKLVIAALRAKAEQHDCLPQHVALALLKAVVTADLIDAVFDGDPPQAFVRVPAVVAGPPAKATQRPPLRLGATQRRFLEWFASQPPGPVELSTNQIAETLSAERWRAHEILQSLTRRGFLEVAQQGKRGGQPTFYQLVRGDVA
ncbi:helix-turn-helix domain-containing protein [Agrobacterium vitis]|uniref:Response regulator transcription factor n=1 Tax=Agrobacterium vitis TaxID=373 RepID=A0AAE2RCA6_AGRVI|nr:helix-turn-helix domain-containing protein [Agrobacterium vitis]MBF2715701.1 response regulator transcription factor [Agrobacterium vitis]